MNYTNTALVFISAFLVNFLWACYVKQIGKSKMLRAAIYGELIVICGAISTINFINNQLYLIPMIVGGFAGTLLTNKLCRLLKIN